MVRKLIKCPECGADNGKDARFCSLCGATIYKFCPECGKKNIKAAKFCMDCGASFESEIDSLETQNNEIYDKEDIFSDNSGKKVSLNLTPAESLMLLDPKKYVGHKESLKELLKVTLIDLILKDVFELSVETIYGRKTVKRNYLKKGKSFSMTLKPHEDVFRRCLLHKADSKRLQKLQEHVYHNALQHDYIMEKLLEPLASNGFFIVKKGFLRNKYVLSDKGIKAQEIMLKLKDEGKNLENWLETDPERAKAYLQICGSNIFLADEYNFKCLKDNSKKIKTLFSNKKSYSDASKNYNYGWYPVFMQNSDNNIFSNEDIDRIFNSIDANNFDFEFSNIESSNGSGSTSYDGYTYSGGCDSSSYSTGFDGSNSDGGSWGSDGGSSGSSYSDGGGSDGGGGDCGGGDCGSGGF